MPLVVRRNAARAAGADLHADVTHQDMYAAVDLLMDKLDSQVRKHKEKITLNVARRTVAKYREAMAIPPSNERKRLA